MSQFAEVVRQLLHSGLPCALYRAPHEAQLQVCLQGEGPLFSTLTLDEAMKEKGYIFAPFCTSEQDPIYVIRPDFCGTIPFSSSKEEQIFDQIIGQNQASDVSTPLQPATSFEQYQVSFDQTMLELVSGKVDKVVLSKVVTVKGAHPAHMAQYLERMMEVYPQAYVFCVILPGKALWLGASPENLMTYKSGKIQLDSLAATRLYEPTAELVETWSEKEIQEQQYVTRYITKGLQKVGVKHLHCTPLGTRQAGHLIHLYQLIQGEVKQTLISDLIQEIHPTPAVCGVPKRQAMDTILRLESHQRHYYSGFLGMVSHDQVQLYVNLRSLSLTDEGAQLYVGGGITLGSVLEQEWDETENKAQTLLTLIQDNDTNP